MLADFGVPCASWERRRGTSWDSVRQAACNSDAAAEARGGRRTSASAPLASACRPTQKRSEVKAAENVG